jgi:hypothetical protein
MTSLARTLDSEVCESVVLGVGGLKNSLIERCADEGSFDGPLVCFDTFCLFGLGGFLVGLMSRFLTWTVDSD